MLRVEERQSLGSLLGNWMGGSDQPTPAAPAPEPCVSSIALPLTAENLRRRDTDVVIRHLRLHAAGDDVGHLSDRVQHVIVDAKRTTRRQPPADRIAVSSGKLNDT